MFTLLLVIFFATILGYMGSRAELKQQYGTLRRAYRLFHSTRRAIGEVAQRQYQALPGLNNSVNPESKLGIVFFKPNSAIQTANGTVVPDMLAVEGGVNFLPTHPRGQVVDTRRVTLFCHDKATGQHHTLDITPNGTVSHDGKKNVVAPLGIPLPLLGKERRRQKMLSVAREALAGIGDARIIEAAGEIAGDSGVTLVPPLYTANDLAKFIDEIGKPQK